MKTENVIKIVLAVMLILCLAPMPYGYYELVRFSSMLGFSILGYQSFKDKNEIIGIIFFGLALLFQPFWKVNLGRDIWQVVDVLVAAGLIISIFLKKIQIMKKKLNPLIIGFMAILIIASACQSRNDRLKKEDQNQEKIETVENIYNKSEKEIGKVIFLLENSGSMKGYVNGDTDFKTSVTALAHFPDFDELQKTFYFISGKDRNCKVSFIGNSGHLDTGLKSDYYIESYSDLTKMFEVALDSSLNNKITILITDGLYDVGESIDPIKALEREVEKTQETFREKLNIEDVQTLVIKSYSHFKGSYCFASKAGTESIDQQRPYYIFIFGKSSILNDFKEEKLRNKIRGFDNMARFLIIDEMDIPFQATALNKLGNFRFDKHNKNKLVDVENDRNGRGFQFSFAVDFTSLPYTESYFQAINNYSKSGNYNVTSVKKVEKKIYEVTSFVPSHLITVTTTQNPYCELEISLKNVVPDWMSNTHKDDESIIAWDTTQTFGFMSLINAISGAYSYKNEDKNITSFIFEIIK